MKCKLFFFKHFIFFQAIQNPNNEALQEQAWAAVVPLVGKLKKFYEFSQRLGMHHPLMLSLEEFIFRLVWFHVERMQTSFYSNAHFIAVSLSSINGAVPRRMSDSLSYVDDPLTCHDIDSTSVYDLNCLHVHLQY